MKHMSAWFSGAYDGELGQAKQALFDAHLEGCSDCRDQFAAFTTAVKGLGGLAGARMPTEVVLPSTPPVAAVAPWWSSWLRTRVLAPIAVGAVGAAAALTLLVANPSLHAGAPGTAALDQQKSVLAPNAAGSGALGAGALTTAQAPNYYDNNCAATLIPGETTSVPPADFTNVITQTDSSRPGEVLYLATQQTSYARGSTITVFAVLVDTNTGKVTDYSSCVYLEATDQTGLMRALPSPNPNNPSVYLTVSSPQVLVSGGQVNLVARIPQDYPNVDQVALTATLQITLT